MEKNHPEKKFRAGAISATIWKNEALTHEGKPISFNRVSIERTYKDNNEWKKTHSYKYQDLPKIALVAQKAYEYIVMTGDKDTQIII